MEDAAANARVHIKSLEDADVALKKRITTLETQVSKLPASTHIVLADPVTDLLDRLQRLMNDFKLGSDPLVDQVSAAIVGAFPTDAKKDFVRRVVVKLEERLHPRAKENVHALLSDLESKIEGV